MDSNSVSHLLFLVVFFVMLLPGVFNTSDDDDDDDDDYYDYSAISDRAVFKMDGKHYLYIKGGKPINCLSSSAFYDETPPSSDIIDTRLTDKHLKSMPMCDIVLGNQAIVTMDGKHYRYDALKTCLNPSSRFDKNPPTTQDQYVVAANYTTDDLRISIC
jgi:hypothetical protein